MAENNDGILNEVEIAELEDWQKDIYVRVQHSMRPRRVVVHILRYGQVTTEELERIYGYTHPPRAAMDVKDAGISLKTIRVPSSDGRRKIGAYVFDRPDDLEEGKSGRAAFSKAFKNQLYLRYGGRCAICNGNFEKRHLQIDHRIPYWVAGDVPDPESHPEQHMLLCGSCNRAKSWTCEHCVNWQIKDATVCSTCYWAYPEEYIHIATEPIRMVRLVWTGDEVEAYKLIEQEAARWKTSIQEYAKAILEKGVKGNE